MFVLTPQSRWDDMQGAKCSSCGPRPRPPPGLRSYCISIYADTFDPVNSSSIRACFPQRKGIVPEGGFRYAESKMEEKNKPEDRPAQEAFLKETPSTRAHATEFLLKVIIAIPLFCLLLYGLLWLGFILLFGGLAH